MSNIYLTPAAIGYLTQVVLALALTAYLVYRLRTARRRNEDVRALRLVAGIFLTVTVLVTLLFGDAALAPTQRLYAVYGENTAIGLLLTLLLQFAYAFPQRYPQRRWEARLALALSLGYTLWEAGFALYRGLWLLPLDQVLYRPRQADYAMAVLFLCVPLAFLRQMTAAAPRQPARRALRAFALILLIPLGLSLLTLARDVAAIHPAVFQPSLSAGILLTQFLFALNYLNALPALIPFQVRLVGITLLGMLAVFGAVGWALTPPYAAVYHPAIADHQTLRFTPNAQGGYAVTPVAFQFDPEPGALLAMETPCAACSAPDALAAVPFTLPFYGETVETLWVLQSGAVGMGAPLRVPNMEYHYATTPAIFPLFVTLNTTPGGVFAKDAGERLTLTWQGLHGWHDPQATYTFQLVLHRDGVFTITTNGLPNAPYEPNTSPFSNVWVTGATPGLRAPPPQQVSFADGPLQGGPQGVLQDHYLASRAYLHHLLTPLAVLMLVSSLAVALGLPMLFYSTLSRSLNTLLAGVRRVKGGDLATTMPVQRNDEVGFLTEAFNDMVAQLHDLITGLETRVAERTGDLEQTNTRLRQEIDQRQAAQAQVVVQERALAAAEEREHLSRELHDGLGQVMGYLNVQAQAVQTLLTEGQTTAAQSNLQQMAQAAQDAHGDIRNYILGLRQPSPTPGDLRQALESYLRQFAASQGLRATLSYPDDPPCTPFTLAVEEQVLRIVQEALANVRKHAAATRVEVLFSFSDEQAQIIISDDGVGFDPTAAPTPLSPLPTREGGATLPPLLAGEGGRGVRSSSIAAKGEDGIGHFGLAVMRERAAQVGGRLEVRSTPGQGARVILTLPCVVSQSAGQDDVSAMRVLLADDHPLFLDGLRSLLTARGVNVIGLAHNGLEAQAQAHALRPNLIILDLNMPVCNGLEAVRAIKAELPEIKIVMLTVSEDERDLFEALKSGASGYLLKSLDANELIELLAGVMRGEAPLPPALAARLVAELAATTLPPGRGDERGGAGRGEEGVPAELTPRQWEILQRVARGVTYKEIAATLYLTEDGVKYHMGRILDRLHLASREEAIAFARRRGDGGTR